MDFVRFEFLIEELRKESRRNLSSVNIMKILENNEYKEFRFAAISSVTSIIIFLLIVFVFQNIDFAMTLLLIFFIFLYFKVMKFNKVIKKSENKMQDYRLAFIENKIIDLKVNSIELNELIRHFEEQGVKNQRTNLRLSAAFAILLLPVWEIIVNSIFELKELSAGNLGRIMTLIFIFGIIILILTFYLYLERKLLYFYNYYPKVDLNISRMLKIIVFKRNENVEKT